jgi:hypothetical protein
MVSREPIFLRAYWIQKLSLQKIKKQKDVSLFKAVLREGGNFKYKLTTKEFLLLQYKRFNSICTGSLFYELVLKDNYNCLEKHLDYMQNVIIMVKYMLVIKYLSQLHPLHV